MCLTHGWSATRCDRQAATFALVNRGLAHYTALDPRRPWPGVQRDPRQVARALGAMAAGGRVTRLDSRLGRPRDRDEPARASVVAIAPCLLTTIGPRRVLEAAIDLVHVGGLVVVEEPSNPRRCDPEPLLVTDDRVVLWSTSGGDNHDLRIVEFTTKAVVEAESLPVLDVAEAERLASDLGLAPEGAWANWSLDSDGGPWRVAALRRTD